MVYVTGDTHGEHSRFYTGLLHQDGGLSENDYLIVCGDFGYVFNDNAYEKRFLDDLEKLPYTIAFVDGNHENFPAIYSYPIVAWHGGRAHRIRKNIFHLMRGEVFGIEGKLFFVFGGAYSVDKYMRIEGRSWWQQELPCKEEYENAVHNLEIHDYSVDYILTHTMPREMITRFGAYQDEHDMELTEFLDLIYHEVDFRHWYCGHWHSDKDITDNFTVLWYDIKELK